VIENVDGGYHGYDSREDSIEKLNMSIWISRRKNGTHKRKDQKIIIYSHSANHELPDIKPGAYKYPSKTEKYALAYCQDEGIVSESHFAIDFTV
jgi:hypothetical protein